MIYINQLQIIIFIFITLFFIYIMLPQANSLVKYSTPVLVSVSIKKNLAKKNEKLDDQTHKTQDILGQILPPKQFKMQNGQLWIQTVLSTPATKNQVVQLQQQLDKRLAQRQARQIGLCPDRQQLYQQCFDELIRQITIDCRQRGLLLVRVRNQYQNQINAYKTLYQSSIAYGMRRIIDSEQKKGKLQNQIAALQRECLQKQKLVQQLQQKIKQTKMKESEKLKKENEIHKQQVQKIKQLNQQLKTTIQNTIQKKL